MDNLLTLLQKVCLVYSHSSIALQNFALVLQDTFRCHRKGLITRDRPFKLTFSLYLKAAGAITSTDADSVLAAVQDVKPVIIQTLDDFITQKSEVAKLNEELNGLTKLAESDLKALESNTSVSSCVSLLLISRMFTCRHIFTLGR